MVNKEVACSARLKAMSTDSHVLSTVVVQLTNIDPQLGAINTYLSMYAVVPHVIWEFLEVRAHVG